MEELLHGLITLAAYGLQVRGGGNSMGCGTKKSRIRQLNGGACWGIALFVLCCGCEGKKATEPKPLVGTGPAVVVSEVRQRTVPVYQELVARTEAKETVEVRARVEGVLEKQLFKEGSMVKKDQPLYLIDRRPFEAKLQSAKAQVAIARARLNQANAQLKKCEKDVSRLRPLAAEQAVPQQDLDAAVAQAKIAAASLEEAKAAVDAGVASAVQAQLNLEYCSIAGPLGGLIGRTQVSVGNLVGQGQPTLLATISSIDPILVTFAIPEADYLRFFKQSRKNSPSSASDTIDLILADDSNYQHKGKFVIAERAVDTATGTLALVAEFPNPEGLLRPGQFGRVRITAEEVTDAILVPRRAVMEQQSAKIAYVVGADNKVALRTLTLGGSYESFFIVKEGLAPGERVIVEGQLKARPGLPVSPVDKPLTEEKKG